MEAVNRKMKSENLPAKINEIVKRYSCNEESKTCMFSECNNCPCVEVPEELLVACSDGEKENEQNDEEEENKLVYYKWTTVDNQVQKVRAEAEAEKLNEMISEKVMNYTLYAFLPICLKFKNL